MKGLALSRGGGWFCGVSFAGFCGLAKDEAAGFWPGFSGGEGFDGVGCEIWEVVVGLADGLFGNFFTNT